MPVNTRIIAEINCTVLTKYNRMAININVVPTTFGCLLKKQHDPKPMTNRKILKAISVFVKNKIEDKQVLYPEKTKAVNANIISSPLSERKLLFFMRSTSLQSIYKLYHKLGMRNN